MLILKIIVKKNMKIIVIVINVKKVCNAKARK